MAFTRSSQKGMVWMMPLDFVAEVRRLRGRDRASSKAYFRIRSTPRRVKTFSCTAISSSVPG